VEKKLNTPEEDKKNTTKSKKKLIESGKDLGRYYGRQNCPQLDERSHRPKFNSSRGHPVGELHGRSEGKGSSSILKAWDSFSGSPNQGEAGRRMNYRKHAGGQKKWHLELQIGRRREGTLTLLRNENRRREKRLAARALSGVLGQGREQKV